jgi:hypothetical protein
MLRPEGQTLWAHRHTVSRLDESGVDPCFIEARDLKLRELEKEWSTAKASPQQGAPKTVELGFTGKQVVDILGQPEKILKVGPKTIYVYKDVKVSFTDGRLADLQ